MDILTRLILEDTLEDDPDKHLKDKEKKIEKMEKNTLAMKPPVSAAVGMAGATREIRIDKLTTMLLERNCGKNHTWNSLKNKCMPDPPYDEEQDEDVFGIFAGRKNGVNYK